MGEITLNLPDDLLERARRSGLLNAETISEVLSLALGDTSASAPPLPIRSFRAFFEQVHDAVFLLDLTGHYLAVNGRAAEMFGYTVDEIQRKGPFELSAQPDATQDIMSQVVAGTRIPMLTRLMRRKSGEVFPAEVTVELVRDQDGKPAFIQSIVRDISERQQNEQRIRDAELLLRTIMNAVPHHIYARDREGRYVIANEAAAHAIGATVEDIIGKTDSDFGVPQAEQLVASDSEVFLTGSTVTIVEDEFIDPQGNHYIFSTTKVPLRIPGSGIDAVLGVSTDISELRQAQADLHEAVRQAFALETERQRVHILTRFIQDTSHEFRTPLSIIGTSLYLMKRSDNETRREDHSRVANEQITRITRLLDHLQVMAELDAGIPFHYHDVNLNHLLIDLRGHFLALSERRGIHFETQFDDSLPVIRADPQRLSEACSQLIDNAVRHTESGGSVSVATTCADSVIVVQVRDTGPGIRPDALPHIFDRFWRQDEARTTPGFGLGLPIVQRIIERHGGKIAVESRLDHGSVFTIHLPIQPSPV